MLQILKRLFSSRHGFRRTAEDDSVALLGLRHHGDPLSAYLLFDFDFRSLGHDRFPDDE